MQTNSITTDFWRKPDSNTIAYYTLNWTLNDSSWNDRHLNLMFWTASYWTLNNWKQYWSFNATWTRSWWRWWQTNSKINVSWNITVSYWWRFNWNVSRIRDIITNRDNDWFKRMDNITTGWNILFHWNQRYTSSNTITDNERHNIVCVVENWTLKIYIDTVLDSSKSYTYWSNSAYLSLWYSWQSWSNIDERLKWDVADIIIQSNSRNLETITAYFNKTKSKFWK